MSKEERKRTARMRAYQDFLDLGDGGSVDQLYKQYVERARAIQNRDDLSDEEKQRLINNIPTRTRQEIYDWSKQDRWYERRAERLERLVKQGEEYMESVRERVFEDLASYAGEALSTLVSLLRPGVRDDLRLKAGTEILDRVGVVNHTRIRSGSAKPRKTGEKPKGDVPNLENANEEQIVRYLAERAAQNGEE